MFSLKVIVSSLYFALVVVAPLPPPASRGTDACGPFNHQGDAGFNTCFASVVPGGPAPYGIVCGRDSSVERNLTTDNCGKAAKSMCSRMASGELSKGEWHWTGDHTNSLCRVGIFLSTDPAGAPQPNYRRCLNQIFQPMVFSCINDRYNVATVNIRQLPNVTLAYTGETVNSAYPAYIVSPMALYHSADPPATANVFGDPAFPVDRYAVEPAFQGQNSTQSNQAAIQNAASAGTANTE
ncbi:MAG: hypothetical protein Q9209_003226 [Squamulea sp. 1 TL-2023]